MGAKHHRALRRASTVTFWAGIVLGGVVAAAGGGRPWLVLLLSVLGLGMLVVNDWRHGFGVRLGRDGGLELTRVHDEFAAAVRRSTPVS